MAEPVVVPEVIANGEPFTRWTSVTLNSSMESITSGFSFEHVEPDNVEAEDVGINEGDEVEIRLGGRAVTAGYVDTVRVEETSERGLRFSISGRTYTKDLLDTSAQNDPGEWEDATIRTIAADLLEPYGIGLTLGEQGFDTPDTVTARANIPFRRVTIEPGETVSEVLRRMARLRGLMLMANPDGSLAITIAGTQTVSGALVRGQNIGSGASRVGDERDRFSTYRLLGQTTGDAAWRGDAAAKNEGTATDEHVGRYRPLVLSAEGGEADLSERAAWERNIRAAKGRTARIPVLSWYDPDGRIWRPNRIVDVQHPKLSIRGRVLVSSLELNFTRDKPNTGMLDIVSPDAYDPLKLPRTKANRRMWAAWR